VIVVVSKGVLVMPIWLTDLIEKVPAEVEGRVKRVRDQTRAAIQEALRAECRLVLRNADETEVKGRGSQVPVDIKPGYPAILKDIQFSDDLELVILLGRYRTVLEKANTGVDGLKRLRDELRLRTALIDHIRITDEELQSTANWATYLIQILNKSDPLKRILAVKEDILGVYRYRTNPTFDDEHTINWAKITLFWMVIGLVAEWMGVPLEDLTIVVLTHELAHAYTQLGADIEGRRWPASVFAASESALVEGLAQYYTERVLKRLQRRFGSALKVYKAMLPKQPGIYSTHLPWVENTSPEAVRRAMLEMRRWKQGSLEEFNKRLVDAHMGLHPEGHHS